MTHSFQNEYGEGWIADGILHFVYNSGVIIDLKAAKKIVSDRAQLQHGVSYPLFTDIRGVKFFEKEARDYFANEGCVGITREAFVVNTAASKVMGDFYLTINKPVVSSKMFTVTEDALKYLKRFS